MARFSIEEWGKLDESTRTDVIRLIAPFLEKPPTPQEFAENMTGRKALCMLDGGKPASILIGHRKDDAFMFEGAYSLNNEANRAFHRLTGRTPMQELLLSMTLDFVRRGCVKVDYNRATVGGGRMIERLKKMGVLREDMTIAVGKLPMRSDLEGLQGDGSGLRTSEIERLRTGLQTAKTRKPPMIIDV
jgi:hypothetical protein